MPEFRRVASVSDIGPGGMKGVHVEGTRIAIYNIDGEIYATCDLCSHEDALLSDGWLRGDVVTCPLHGSRFSVRNGQVFSRPAIKPVATYAVCVEGNDIFVALTD